MSEIWEANYKSMDRSRLIDEVFNVRTSLRCPDGERADRLAFLAVELALKSRDIATVAGMPTPRAQM